MDARELWSTLLDEVRPLAALAAAPLTLLRLPAAACRCLSDAVRSGGGADGRPWHSLHLVNAIAGAAAGATVVAVGLFAWEVRMLAAIPTSGRCDQSRVCCAADDASAAYMDITDTTPEEDR